MSNNLAQAIAPALQEALQKPEVCAKILAVAPSVFVNFQLFIFPVHLLDTEPMDTAALAVMQDPIAPVEMVMCTAYYDALTRGGKMPHWSETYLEESRIYVRAMLDPVFNVAHVSRVENVDAAASVDAAMPLELVGSAGPIRE